jgi:hypothetical protein
MNVTDQCHLSLVFKQGVWHHFKVYIL